MIPRAIGASLGVSVGVGAAFAALVLLASEREPLLPRLSAPFPESPEAAQLVQRTLGAGEARGAMARMLRDARWGRYHVLQNALYVIPGGAALVSLLLGHTSPVVAGLAVVGAVGFGIAADVWRYTHYSCGQCRRRLPAPKRWWETKQRPSPIAFECTHCDVVWVTRMSAEE